MLSEKQKGWVFVIIQMSLIFILFIFCYTDRENIGNKESFLSILGITIAVVGFIIAIMVFINFSQPMTPNPIPLSKSELRISGLYKYIRHPMYSSLLLSLFGVVIYFKSISAFITWLLAIVFILYKINFEEKKLKEKFPEYSSYSKKTKRLLPLIY